MLRKPTYWNTEYISMFNLRSIFALCARANFSFRGNMLRATKTASLYFLYQVVHPHVFHHSLSLLTHSRLMNLRIPIWHRSICLNLSCMTDPKLPSLLKMLMGAQNQLDEKASYPRITDLSTATLEDPSVWQKYGRIWSSAISKSSGECL